MPPLHLKPPSFSTRKTFPSESLKGTIKPSLKRERQMNTTFPDYQPNGPAEVQCECFGPISGVNFGK